MKPWMWIAAGVTVAVVGYIGYRAYRRSQANHAAATIGPVARRGANREVERGRAPDLNREAAGVSAEHWEPPLDRSAPSDDDAIVDTDYHVPSVTELHGLD